jgi:hypothetical protein
MMHEKSNIEIQLYCCVCTVCICMYVCMYTLYSVIISLFLYGIHLGVHKASVLCVSRAVYIFVETAK